MYYHIVSSAISHMTRFKGTDILGRKHILDPNIPCVHEVARRLDHGEICPRSTPIASLQQSLLDLHVSIYYEELTNICKNQQN